MPKRLLPAPLVFLVVIPAVFFALREYSIPGGDSQWMATLVTRPLYYFLRAPLVVAFHKGLWLLLRGWGWTPADCIALSSSLAGGVFMWGLYRLSWDPRVWIPVLGSKLIFVFVGHVENYAWPYTLSLWSFVFLKETLETPKSSWKMWGTLVVATFCHPMVLMIWPGIFWALYPWNRREVTEALVAVLVFLGLTNFLLLFGKAGGLPQGKWVLPLFATGDTLCRYAFFSWEHWMELLSFHGQTMPIGVFLLLRFGWKGWRGWEGGLFTAAAVTLVWSFVWHPGMGKQDWDLFAWPALFVNLAGGRRWSRIRSRGSPEESVDASGSGGI